MKIQSDIPEPQTANAELPDEANPFETIQSTYLAKPPDTWYPIRIDAVRNTHTGAVFQYTVSEIGPSVGIVALDANQHIHLVGQWRYTFHKYSWELPTGSADRNENMLAAAKRELREETGIEAESWIKLGTIDNSNGATTDEGHLFLATHLTLQTAHPDPNEIIQHIRIPFSAAVEMIFANRITESLSTAAILKAKHYLKL